MPLDACYSLDQTLRLLSIPSPTGYPRQVCGALVETLEGLGFSPRQLRKGGVVCPLGGETGFLVGAMTILASNVLFSQGPWTPFQMFAMGIMAHPVDLEHQKLNLYIPEDYYEGKTIHGYTGKTVPIFFPKIVSE